MFAMRLTPQGWMRVSQDVQTGRVLTHKLLSVHKVEVASARVEPLKQKVLLRLVEREEEIQRVASLPEIERRPAYGYHRLGTNGKLLPFRLRKIVDRLHSTSPTREFAA